MTSASWNNLPLLAIGALAVLACTRGSDSEGDIGGYDGTVDCIDCLTTGGDGSGGMSTGAGGGDGGGGTPGSGGRDYGEVTLGPFELGPDFDGPCERRQDAIDVNLGHTAETAVRALHCQVFGTEPSADVLETWATDLRDVEWVRRIDVALSFCEMDGRPCAFEYSDPWEAQVSLEDTCTRKTDRDLGAVMMFFSECPTGINCDMHWANTHALGMNAPHAVYAFAPTSAGFYHPGNAGFWRREFLDARWAGLSFLLLNTYGPDMDANGKPLARAVEALDDIGGGIGLAMMDDTWSWGNGNFEPPFDQAPNLADTEGAAQTMYQAKWKKFFESIPSTYWYQYGGRPLIYFYNGGTLQERTLVPAVIARMKELFAADFGVEPFVVVDTAFFEDEGAMNAVADGRFTWDSFRDGAPSTFTLGETSVHHAMVRWDALGRDHQGEAIATAGDRLHKGPELLGQFLESSADADLAVLATWNDLGEGTGIHRNYDYFYGDTWLPPHHFLSMIRSSQCEE